MIALLIYSQLADLVTFAFAAGALGTEGNEYGLLGSLVPTYGVDGVAIIKVAVVAVCAIVAFLWSRHPRRRRLYGFLAGFGITVGTLGTLSNVASLAVSV